jgi:hypothetical protein
VGVKQEFSIAIMREVVAERLYIIYGNYSGPIRRPEPGFASEMSRTEVTVKDMRLSSMNGLASYVSAFQVIPPSRCSHNWGMVSNRIWLGSCLLVFVQCTNHDNIT